MGNQHSDRRRSLDPQYQPPFYNRSTSHHSQQLQNRSYFDKNEKQHHTSTTSTKFEEDTSGVPVAITAREKVRTSSISSREYPKKHLAELKQEIFNKGTVEPNVSELKNSSSESKQRPPTIIKYRPNSKVADVDLFVKHLESKAEKRLKMNFSHKDFQCSLHLEPGTYEYSFLPKKNKNEVFEIDPKLEVVERDGHFFNVLRVQEKDYNLHDALDMDLQSNEKGVPPSQTEFGQLVPESEMWEKCKQYPPFLPPHLLQVILNKDTPLSCEPILLPEPNHVMLNHLYALSIKDGVMVLSSTKRFRKKYVTTLLYKPMDPPVDTVAS